MSQHCIQVLRLSPIHPHYLCKVDSYPPLHSASVPIHPSITYMSVLIHPPILMHLFLSTLPFLLRICSYLSPNYSHTYFYYYWHERAAFQRSSFGPSRSGGRLLAMTQWPLKTPLFSFSFFSLFSVATFSHRRNDLIKKLIQRKLIGGSNNLRFDLFPDPIGHFG